MSEWYEKYRVSNASSKNEAEEPMQDNQKEWYEKYRSDSKPQEKKDSGESLGRLLSQTPRNALAGAGDVLDLPIYLLDKGLQQVGLSSGNPLYPGKAIAEGIDYLTNNYTKPQTKRERIAEGTTRAIAGIPTGYGAGVKLAGMGNKAASMLGRGLASVNPVTPSNIAATGAGAAANHLYSETNPNDAMGSFGAGLGADIATRTALGITNPRMLASAIKINPKKIETFKEIGLTPTLGQASDNKLIKSSEQYLKNIGLSDKLNMTMQHQYDKFKEILGPGVNKIANSELQAGKLIKESLKEYGEKVSNRTQKLKDAYLRKVKKSGNDLIDVGDSWFFGKQLEGELRTETAKNSFLKTPVGREYKKLEQMASENAGKVPLSDVEDFRKNLLDMITKGDTGTISTGRLEHIRGILNKDIKKYMKTIGAEGQWNTYNKYYAKYAEKHKPHVVQAKDTPISRANEIFDSIGESGKLDRPLLESVYASQKKPQQKETMDSIIQKMSKRGDETDLHQLSKRFQNQPEETQNILLSAVAPDQRRKIKHVFKAIDNIKDLNTYGNPSRTAYTNSLIAGANIAGTGALSIITGDIPTSLLWSGTVAASQIGISRNLFSNPKFVNWLYRGTKIKTPRGMKYHNDGLKHIVTKPVYQEFKNIVNRNERKQSE